MKKYNRFVLLVLFLVTLATSSLMSQGTASHLRTQGSNPAACNPGDFNSVLSAGTSIPYYCNSSAAWVKIFTAATSPLLAAGIVDGDVPVTSTTGTTATLGAATYLSGYTMNQEATAGTGVTYTLPATVKGMQYCVKNSIVSGTGAADTGVLTVYPPASSYVIVNGTRNTIGGGGTHGVASGGAAGDAACFVAIDSTDWEVYVEVGTWTAN